jgi:hypothetical protein
MLREWLLTSSPITETHLADNVHEFGGSATFGGGSKNDLPGAPDKKVDLHLGLRQPSALSVSSSQSMIKRFASERLSPSQCMPAPSASEKSMNVFGQVSAS